MEHLKEDDLVFYQKWAAELTATWQCTFFYTRILGWWVHTQIVGYLLKKKSPRLKVNSKTWKRRRTPGMIRPGWNHACIMTNPKDGPIYCHRQSCQLVKWSRRLVHCTPPRHVLGLVVAQPGLAGTFTWWWCDSLLVAPFLVVYCSFCCPWIRSHHHQQIRSPWSCPLPILLDLKQNLKRHLISFKWKYLCHLPWLQVALEAAPTPEAVSWHFTTGGKAFAGLNPKPVQAVILSLYRLSLKAMVHYCNRVEIANMCTWFLNM